MKTTIFIKVYLRNWAIITCYDCKAAHRSSKLVMKSIKIPKTLDAYSYQPLRNESLDSRGDCLISRDKLLDRLERQESHLARGCYISGTVLERSLDCLQSAFFLKIGLLLISSSAIANHDVVITIRDWDEKRQDEKRRTADSFEVNKTSVSPEINGVTNWSIVEKKNE